jgi:hypothetical protein
MAATLSRNPRLAACALGLLIGAAASAAAADPDQPPSPAPAASAGAPDQDRLQLLAEATKACAALQTQLDGAIHDHQPDAAITALQRTLAESQSRMLGLRYQPMLSTLLEAILANDLARFQSVCDDGMRAEISADVLLKTSENVKAALRGGGYTVLGPLAVRRNGADALCYALRPASGGDDVPIMLTVLAGKCVGFQFP